MPDVDPIEEAPAHGEGSASAAQPQIDEAGLRAIVQELCKGVDKLLGASDHDTRYHLGIGYREMGLLDEAIAQLTLAAEDPRRALECACLLAGCFTEKGAHGEAAAWLERGLAAPTDTPDEHRALRYQLALAYEAAGEKRKALDQLSRIAEQGVFRDVADRARRLRSELA